MGMRETAAERRRKGPRFGANFMAVLEVSRDLVCLCADGVVIDINGAGIAMLGAAHADQVIGHAFRDLVGGGYAGVIDDLLHLKEIEDSALPIKVLHMDGGAFEAELQIHPARELGSAHAVVTARDISRQGRLARTARDSEDRFFVESLLEAVPNPLWWKDIEGRYLGYNGAFRELHGIGSTDWVGRTTAEMVNPEFAATSAKADMKALGESGQVQFEAHLKVAEDEALDVVVSKTVWRGRDKKAEGVIGVMLDITDRKRMEAELRRLATTDVLTGAFNRRHFMETAATEMERARRHGHPVGDVDIKALSDACARELRNEDVLGRMGGEEFAIVLTETDLAGALLVAERLRLAIADIRIPAGEGTVSFTASIGAAERLEDDTTIDAMLSRADTALYDAKRSGRNKVAVG